MSRILDKDLYQSGLQKMDWAFRYMPALMGIHKRFSDEKPLKGIDISLSVHMEAKTANLVTTLAAGGANVYATGCNPLSTQDDVAAALAFKGFEVNAVYGVGYGDYVAQLKATLDNEPHVIVDDGGDLLSLLHDEYKHRSNKVIGGCEETTTGINRIRAMEKSGRLAFPMISVNDGRCKHLFDNRYGTGQSVMDGIIRTTNMLIAGKNVVIAGYGWCGRGIALRARGLGAKIIICEIDPVKAYEATMEGFSVLSMDEAAEIGEMFITVTGCKDVICKRHFSKMKDGVVLANAGHFNVEINMDDLAGASVRIEQARKNIDSYIQKDGRRINVIAEGRLVNLAAADGHPIEIMDMSFALQALSVEYLVKHRGSFEKKLYPVPEEIDNEVARVKLQSEGICIDSLTPEQHAYLYGE